MGWFGVGARKIEVPKTVRFWLVQHPKTKKYADIWLFPYMGEMEYGGHDWVSEIMRALPFSTQERAREWWDGNKRAMGWDALDEYTMGLPDFVQVESLPDEVQKGRTDSQAILDQLKGAKE